MIVLQNKSLVECSLLLYTSHHDTHPSAENARIVDNSPTDPLTNIFRVYLVSEAYFNRGAFFYGEASLVKSEYIRNKPTIIPTDDINCIEYKPISMDLGVI